MSEKQYRALKDALASTRMEGYTITTHTEKTVRVYCVVK